MKKKYLIFTPVKSTWPQDHNDSLLFTSESALLSDNGTQKKYKDIYVNSIRWKNEKILYEDFNKLELIYEKFLGILSSQLNEVHKINNSLRTWRIILGPWLSTFLHIFYERFNNVQKLLNDKKIDKCIFLQFKDSFFVPYDHNQFINYSQDDLWNQYLYQRIATNFLEKDKIILKEITSRTQIKILEKASNYFSNQRKTLLNLKKIILSFFNIVNKKKYKYFFYGTYLGFVNEVKLSFKFKQLPIFYIEDTLGKDLKVNIELRKKLKTKHRFNENFENLFFEAIWDLLPKLFLENYSDFELFSKKANIPKNPKKIFMSAAIWYETKLLYHVAKLIEKKSSSLLYGQHGGSYGLCKYNWHEKYEQSVADKYLSWGWRSEKNINVKSFFILKNLKKKNINGENLLVILKARKRYFHSLQSSTSIELYSNYILNISKFIFQINDNIKDRVTFRLPFKSLNVKNVDFFDNLNKNFKFNNLGSFSDACSRSKLIIHSSNSTPFLETISANMPSILIINKNTNPFREDAKDYIDALFENKIIFYDPVLASKFVNDIWNDKINIWWKSEKTQSVIAKFSEKYARKTDKILHELEKVINNYD